MRFIPISPSTTLEDIITRVGNSNVDNMLTINGLTRSPNIGKQFSDLCDDSETAGVIDINQPGPSAVSQVVPNQRKYTMLNEMSTDSDVFEHAALMSDGDWVVYNNLGTFRSYLRVPEGVSIPDTSRTDSLLGNGVPVGKEIHQMALKQIVSTGKVDPALFNEYSSSRPSTLVNAIASVSQPMQWFNIPWGSITLYSSLSGTAMDIPVYPEEYEDGVFANYDTMPELLYQYEPWQLYKSSGRTPNSFKFDMHRDMWTGDHRDGKCRELIRFCEANCYPDYNGSLVNTSLVTLYVNGSSLIRGVLTAVNVSWDGPIGLDGYYLHCVLTLSITEVSEVPLDYSTVARKGLIG